VSLEADLAARLDRVRGRIARAAKASGRDPSDVLLVAVSKTYPASHVRAAYAAGQRDFGENRVQEALPKIEATSDLPVRWHLVGHLQSNKVRKAATSFPVVHSIDSAPLLEALDRAALAAGVRSVLTAAVEHGGTTIINFKTPDGIEGAYWKKLDVYDRSGQPCHRCGAGHPIRRTVLAGRSTFHCPHCQR